MGLEEQILKAVNQRASLKVIELLLHYGGLKQTYTGGLSGGLGEAIKILGIENSINLEKEKRFLEGIRHLSPKITGKKEEYHMACGRFHGYPECCITNFLKCSMPAVRFDNKFLTKPIDYILDKLYHAYTFHVPCRINCGKTKRIAEKYQLYVREKFPAISLAFEIDYIKRRANFLKRRGLAHLI